MPKISTKGQPKKPAKKKKPKITDEMIAAEQLRFERHVAATLMEALSGSGLPLSEIDKRLRMPEGWTQTYFIQLMNGDCGLARDPIRIATAMGLQLQLSTKDMIGPSPIEDLS